MVKGKTTNGLMRHLREKHGISINGSKHKKELLNMGYYHGYKGYRFIRESTNRVPYSNFDEIASIYQFDLNLKALFYPNIMLIETALKNYTLDTLIKLGPVDFEHIFSHLLDDYKKHPVGSRDYRKKLKNRLNLRNKINNAIAYNYSEQKDVIQHFFHTNQPIPLWAIFEVISLGEFGFFLQCLNHPTRTEIAKDLGMHTTSHNQNGRILENIIFLIKELRNSIAHNHVVFDCRFKKSNPPSRLKTYLQSETNISNIQFVNIVDYFIIVIFIMKKLGITKTELKRLIRNFYEESELLRKNIPISVHTSIMGSDLKNKISQLLNYV
ncbi:Abi family protein [Bacillus sp. C3(2022)]|uniref:Abi family protein n=1 Tax=Bacillus TaxID=1386 RepID=UPI0003ED9CF3|nr:MULTISPECIES: Abi family protein [Bacillus]EWH20006.1 CAAX protease [Bacillus haynesii]TWJ94348.1 hypothetical protein CHCC20493_0508 [Bacillus licheniformis]TWL93709.1 hypothetical protein CHCC15292_4514 [Bacillus licheniformis]